MKLELDPHEVQILQDLIHDEVERNAPLTLKYYIVLLKRIMDKLYEREVAKESEKL